MTEAEWLGCVKPRPMLGFLRGKASDRKLRLFAVGCAYKNTDRLPPAREHHIAIEVGERFADGNATREELLTSCRAAHQKRREFTTVLGIAAADCANLIASQAAYQCLRFSRLPDQVLCHSLREIFANPFCPITLNPSWLTSTVLALANGIYSEKAFDRMPILADALQDAGYDNEDILNHCRQPAEHTRGCWVLDLVLGKT